MKISIVGNFPLKESNSTFQLVYQVAEVLECAGYKARLIGNGSDELREGTTKGIESVSLPFNNELRDLRIFKFVFAWLKQNVTKDEVLIVYSSPTFALFLFVLAKLFPSNLIIGYQADRSKVAHGPLVTRIPRKLNRIAVVVFYLFFCEKMFVVSSPYISFYRSLGYTKPLMVLPPLRKTEPAENDLNPDTDILFVYVGTPWPVWKKHVEVEAFKDRLDIAIDFILFLNERGDDFRFDVIGLSETEYKAIVRRHDKIDMLASGIRFHGRLPLKDAKEFVRQADYSVIIRDKTRMSDFGMSSKLVESIACGTRVITTDTSDIKQYLSRGEALFLGGYGVSDFEKLRVELVKRTSMKDLDNPFDPSLFADGVAEFVQT